MLDHGAYINHLLRKKKFLSKGGGEIIKFLHWQLWDPSRKQQKLKNAFLNDVSVTFKQSFQKYHFSPISGIFWKCYLGFFFLSNFSVKLTLFCVLYILDAARSSGILKAKQKLGRTFNSDKLGGIAFTKISKLTMCSA